MTATLWCVVPAAGRGTRVGGTIPKQYLPLAGRPLIVHTLERLAAHPRIAGLMVVLGEGDSHWPGVDRLYGKPVHTAIGGAERCDSVLAGVHDAARPCVREGDITRLIDLGVAAGGGLLGAPLRDTLKRANDEGRSDVTEPRDHRWRAFTPQMFRRSELSFALQSAHAAGVTVSDEAMAMERAGFAPLLVEGAEDNIKVTTATDFALAEFLLSRMK
jgi:2-C-methyl-D-erythritol 4-phosphate cytidylyltransferase